MEIKDFKVSDVIKTIAGTTKNPVFTKDFLGRKVFVGDFVATTCYQEVTLLKLEVIRVTPKGIRDKNGKFHPAASICKIF